MKIELPVLVKTDQELSSAVQNAKKVLEEAIADAEATGMVALWSYKPEGTPNPYADGQFSSLLAYFSPKHLPEIKITLNRSYP